MIKLEDLKQGDVLTVYENGKHINTLTFIARLWFEGGFVAKDPNGNIEEWTDRYLKEVTSWKRDGVELLKPEPEQEEFVFCKIEKNDCNELCVIDTKKIGDKDNWPHTLPQIGRQSGDYTFIGYCDTEGIDTSKRFVGNSWILHKDPIRNDAVFPDSIHGVTVYPYAVFMLTSKLNVGE